MTFLTDTMAANAEAASPHYRIVAIATFVPLLAAWLLSRWLFDLDYGVPAWLLDGLLVLPAMLLASRAVRGAVALLLLGVVFAAAFVVTHAAKIAFLGVPVSYVDVTSGLALLGVLPGWRLAIAITGLVGFFAALLWALRPRRDGVPFLLAMTGYFLLLVVLVQPLAALLDRVQGDAAPRNAIARLKQRGGTLFLFQDLGTRWYARVQAPDASAVAQVLHDRSTAPQLSDAPYRPRNIHLLLLEAFWDPRQLKAYRFSRDPLDPRFRALWRDGRHSTVLSPVFGGATANAEFEALCGLPANGGEIVFEKALTQSIPCMPRVLREAGYLTIASHPYQAAYWNRDEAYPRLGFERYNAIGAFRLDDMDGMFLHDASTYRQVLERLAQLPGDRPHFSYLVSLSSHYPYSRNDKQRPKLVSVTPQAPLLEAYANALAYSSAAFMDYVETLRSRDPDALIVALGDHAPVLGPDPDPYAQSGIPISGAAAGKGLAQLSQTPLLVIDGPHGSIAMGAIALYSLPSRMLSLLGSGAPNLPYAGVTGSDTATGRTFLAQMIAKKAGDWHLCDDPMAGECSSAQRSDDRFATLRDDLTRGRQHALEILDAGHLAGDVGMVQNAPYGECALKVVAWGPQFNAQARPFNLQPSGRSAIWMKLSDARGKPMLLIGDDQAPVTLAVDGKSASASYQDPRFLKKAGSYPVRYRCGDDDAIAIGTFTVNAQ